VVSDTLISVPKRDERLDGRSAARRHHDATRPTSETSSAAGGVEQPVRPRGSVRRCVTRREPAAARPEAGHRAEQDDVIPSRTISHNTRARAARAPSGCRFLSSAATRERQRSVQAYRGQQHCKRRA